MAFTGDLPLCSHSLPPKLSHLSHFKSKRVNGATTCLCPLNSISAQTLEPGCGLLPLPLGSHPGRSHRTSVPRAQASGLRAASQISPENAIPGADHNGI